MDVVPALVALKFVADKANVWLVNDAGQFLPQLAGSYEEGSRNFIIRISTSQLSEPMSLVGTMAHELAHVRLLGEGRLMREEYDNELLTDLTVVFFGLGIFLANTPRSGESQFTKWPRSNLIKPEYMTRPMFSYALAQLAWFRGEQHPAWIQHLHWNARPELRQAIRFLFRTGESTFTPK